MASYMEEKIRSYLKSPSPPLTPPPPPATTTFRPPVTIQAWGGVYLKGGFRRGGPRGTALTGGGGGGGLHLQVAPQQLHEVEGHVQPQAEGPRPVVVVGVP